ncbi:PQQ-binding-like beta-propeller repeat protein [Gammaproteobacteria bacterium]|nr:PQQ-binding-like beta-propeller repeat protein [Gammaproteobacteria bacterium]
MTLLIYKKIFLSIFLLSLLIIFISGSLPAFSQEDEGAELYESYCMVCHADPEQNPRMPRESDLRNFSPNHIVSAMTNGLMTIQSTALDAHQKIALAEYLTDQTYIESDLTITQNMCQEMPALDLANTSQWNGWSPGVHNTRFQSAQAGGITVDNIPQLKLKWAYGLPAEVQARGQPAVVGDHLFVGSQAGALYALDAKSGCTYWSFLPQAGIRSAVSVGPVTLRDGSASHAVYFVDRQANAYAINAETGLQIWSTKIESHSGARASGSVTYYEGRLYVPMSGINEGNIGSDPDYPCCTFRGSMSALDANVGTVIWKTYTIGEPQRRGISTNGQPLWGPSGVGIWNAPTIDEKRGLLYSGTGPAYSSPAPVTTDAVIAFEMDTGDIRWVNQFTVDVWSGGCGQNSDSNPNCPENTGPDVDFSASPILTTTETGRDIIVIPQKSGEAHALDPDNNGATLWTYRAGPGGAVGGVWGSAVEGNIMYVAVGGYFNEVTGGIHAINIETGERIWYTPPQDLLCSSGPGCSPTQAAAVTAVPGAVFSGSADGGLRAYSAEDGNVIWTFNANREFETINGIPANGASFDGPGPVIADGMLYVLSGDAGFVGRPGNVLLAFSIE